MTKHDKFNISQSKHHRIKFGKYKGKKFKDIPLPYLKWCLESGLLFGKHVWYVKTKLKLPKSKYWVVTEDDEHYVVSAYEERDALNKLRTEGQAWKL